MPISIIILYVILALRIVFGGVFVAAVIHHSLTNDPGFGIGIINVAICCFILLTLIQKKYLAIPVFRVYVIISVLVVLASELRRVFRSDVYDPVQLLHVTGVCIGVALAIWFQAALGTPKVRKYFPAGEAPQNPAA